MELYRFGKEIGKEITHYESNFIMSQITEVNQIVKISCMYLGADGRIGYHQATVPQLLLVIHGQGYVRNEEKEYIDVKSGDAVFFNKGEWHETNTITGMTAIVIEAEELNPELHMPLKNGKYIL